MTFVVLQQPACSYSRLLKLSLVWSATHSRLCFVELNKNLDFVGFNPFLNADPKRCDNRVPTLATFCQHPDN